MNALKNLKYGEKAIISTERIEVVIYKNATSSYTIAVKEINGYSMDDLFSKTVADVTTYGKAKEVAETITLFINNTFNNHKVSIRKAA